MHCTLPSAGIKYVLPAEGSLIRGQPALFIGIEILIAHQLQGGLFFYVGMHGHFCVNAVFLVQVLLYAAFPVGFVLVELGQAAGGFW